MRSITRWDCVEHPELVLPPIERPGQVKDSDQSRSMIPSSIPDQRAIHLPATLIPVAMNPASVRITQNICQGIHGGRTEATNRK